MMVFRNRERSRAAAAVVAITEEEDGEDNDGDDGTSTYCLSGGWTSATSLLRLEMLLFFRCDDI